MLGTHIMYVSEISAINVPFTFYCAHGTAEELALVDSGATENFMDARMVERLGIGVMERSFLPIFTYILHIT